MKSPPDAPSWAHGLALVLQKAWERRGPLARGLRPLSLLVHAWVQLRRLAYRRGWRVNATLPVPVVVVGNVVVGGVGKTPVVIALVQWLQAQGLRVGVISRGHGRRTQDCREVLPSAEAQDVGDEPALIHARTQVPVFVARQRVAAAQALLARHPDIQVLVSDDGLQHLALPRAVEICVFDQRGVGNGWTLPAGPLREPWPRAVDVVLHTAEPPAFPDGWSVRRRLAPRAVRADGTEVALAALARQQTPVLAVAGIGQPQTFFQMLRSAGLNVQATQAWPDHYDFDSYKVNSDAGWVVICTEKDAIKLWRHVPWALAVRLEVTVDPAAWDAVWARLAPWLGLSWQHGQPTAGTAGVPGDEGPADL